MTFRDLKFIPHKVIPKKGIQATLEVKPQVFVSVIAGDGFYSMGKSGNRKAVTDPKDVSSFDLTPIFSKILLSVAVELGSIVDIAFSRFQLFSHINCSHH